MKTVLQVAHDRNFAVILNPFSFRPSTKFTHKSCWLFLKTILRNEPPLTTLFLPLLSLARIITVAFQLVSWFLSLLSYSVFSPPSSQHYLSKICKFSPLPPWLLISLRIIVTFFIMIWMIPHNLSSLCLPDLTSHCSPSCLFHFHTLSNTHLHFRVFELNISSL